MGRAAQAWTQEVLAGESRGLPLGGGTTKVQGVEGEDREAWMMDPTRGATITATHGVTTSTRMTGEGASTKYVVGI